MTAKVQIKNDRINCFGGIFFAIDQFRASRLAKLVNNTLGSKGLNARFKFSDILENMASIFLSGGEVLEDVNFFRQEAFGKNPDYRFCSADTIARDLLLQESQRLFPRHRAAQPASVLHREPDGNASVKLDQAETLERAFAQLKANGIKVDKARMDCGSYSQEVVEFYNQRGASERTFDMQNNDFGWKHLPFSFMKENTVLMILTALIRNFYVWLVGKISANKAFGLEATSRVKKFVFRFVQVPYRWVFRSRQWHLQLYTSRPYDRLRL